MQATDIFPALEEAGVPRNGGPIAVMLGEHERGREHVREMVIALATLHTAEGRTRFGRGALGFAQLLEQHIAKENNVLFMIAERALSPERDAALVHAYAPYQDKATYEATLAELSRRWL